MRFIPSTEQRTVTPPNDAGTNVKTIRTCFGSSTSPRPFEKKRRRDKPWKRGKVGSGSLTVKARVISWWNPTGTTADYYMLWV